MELRKFATSDLQDDNSGGMSEDTPGNLNELVPLQHAKTLLEYSNISLSV